MQSYNHLQVFPIENTKKLKRIGYIVQFCTTQHDISAKYNDIVQSSGYFARFKFKCHPVRALPLYNAQ